MYMERVDYLTKFTNEGMQLALNHPEKVKDEKGFRRQVAEGAINILEHRTKELRKEKDQEIAIQREKIQKTVIYLLKDGKTLEEIYVIVDLSINEINELINTH